MCVRVCVFVFITQHNNQKLTERGQLHTNLHIHITALLKAHTELYESVKKEAAASAQHKSHKQHQAVVTFSICCGCR